MNNEREKTANTLIRVGVILLVSGLLVLGASILLPGCNKPYLPWVRSSNWDRPAEEPPREPREPLTRLPLEDFCEDNRETVALYRTFLDPDYDWGVSPNVEARRRQYCQQFVDQYAELCENNQNVESE